MAKTILYHSSRTLSWNYMYHSICMTLPKLTCEVNYRMRLKESLVVVRKMPPRRGVRRGGRGGRGRGARCVQTEVQPVAQATKPAHQLLMRTSLLWSRDSGI